MKLQSTKKNSGDHTAYRDQPEQYGEKDQTNDDQPLMQMVLEWENQAKEQQAENRREMAIDEDFADGKQFSDEELAILAKRGQPAIQQNLIKPAIEWTVGTEKRTRMEAKAYPRQDTEEANESASNKTKLIKYLNDVNKAQYARSAAFRDAVTVGLGWLEDGIRNDDTDEPAFSRRETWRNMWYDHLSVEPDLSDARYLFRQKWVDLDVAQAMFPEKHAVLESCANGDGGTRFDDEDEIETPQAYMQHDSRGYRVGGSVSIFSSSENRRRRVRLTECWYKEPRIVKKMRSYEDPAMNGKIFDKEDEKHLKAATEEIVSLYDSHEMIMRVVIFCETKLLQEMDSPYRHNRFPFTPVWGYRRGRDNAPYGIVRNMRDTQRDRNARMAKALHILSTRQIIASAKASKDWDAVRDQAAAPDGIMLVEGDSNMRFEFVNNNELANEHVMLMDKDEQYMTRSSGVTDENLGQDSSAISGKAILAKQNEGSVVTFTLFDNLRFALQNQGEIQTSNIEQFYSEPKQIRIIGDNSKHEFASINEMEVDPFTGEVSILNDITAFQDDFIIDTSDFRQSVRQAQFEAMMDLISRMDPEVSLQVLDLAIEMSDISNKDEWVRRIRGMNGQHDADDKLTPEEQQKIAQQQQEEAEQAQLLKDAQQADIDKKQAEIRKINSGITNDKIGSVKEATETAAEMVMMPALTTVTDALLESAGYEDQTDIGSINVPNIAPPPNLEAQAEVKEHKTPEPSLDPNTAYNTDSRERVDMEKIKAGKDTAKKPAAKKKATKKKAKK